MTIPKWFQGGAFTPTVLATLLSLLAAPVAGLGVIAFLFGAWVPAVILVPAGAALWVTGRRMLDR